MFCMAFIFIYGKQQYIYYLSKQLKMEIIFFLFKSNTSEITGEQTEVDK